MISLSSAWKVDAANYTYSASTTTTTQWSAGTSWSATPVSASDTTLDFSATQAAGINTISNNDLGGNFTLNRLNITYAGPASGTAPTLLISGNALAFTSNGATAPTLVFGQTGTSRPSVTISNNVILSSNLTISNPSASNTAILSGTISGSGGLNKTSGTGGVNITGTNNSFSGAVVISASGSLTAVSIGNTGSNSSLGTNASITLGGGSNSGQLNWTGSNETTDKIFSMGGSTGGATISASTTGQTLTISQNLLISGNGTKTLTLTGSGNIAFNGIIPNGTSPNTSVISVTKSGSGTATLGGANSYTGETRISNGSANVYSLGNFSENSSLGQGTAGVAIIIGSGTTSGTIGMTYLGSGSTSNRTFQIGSGNGSSSATISSSGSGALVFTASSFNTADTGSVSGFSNRTLTLTGTNTGNNEIQGAIINNSNGTVSLFKSSSGTWILSGANTYTGTTGMSAGTLQIGNGGSTGSLSIDSAITNNATLAFNRSNTITQGTDFSAIAGTGNVTQAGNGTTILNSANTYTGATRITAGTLQIGNGGTTGALSTSSTITNNGTLAFNRSNDVVQGTDFSAAAITGTGNLTQSGTGNLTLNAANTYSGATTINSGTLIASGGSAIADTGTVILANASGALFSITGSETIGSLRGGGSSGGNATIAASQTLTVAETSSQAFSGSIQGSGGLTKTGAGTLSLDGANSYSGATTISTGTLQIGSGSTTGALSTSSAITNNATLAFNRTDTVTQGTDFAAVIAGTGAVMQNGSGTLVLNGVNTFTGALSVQTGTLSIASMNNASTTGALGNSATAVTLGSSENTGTLLYTGATASSSKKLTLATGGTGTINVSDPSATLTLSGIIDGSGALMKNGTGTLNLTGANTFSGGFSLNQGWLQMGNSGNGTTNGSLGTGAITLNGGTLSASATTGRTINNAVTIGGDVILGNATNTGALTFSGNVNLGGGTRNLTLESSGTLSGIVSNGGLTKLGAGTLLLSGNNTYSGATTISAGTLQIGAGGTTGSLSTSSAITNNGALVFNRSNAVTQGTDFSGAALTGSGMVIKQGSSDATLNNSTNSFSGGVWVQNGTLYANSFGNSGAPSFLGTNGTIKLGSSSTGGALRFSNGAPVETTDKVIDLAGTTGGGTITAGNATITMTSNLAMSGAGSKTLSFNSSGNTNTFNLTFDGLLADVNGVLSVGFGGSGNGNFLLGNANNSFSGPVTINANTASTTTTLSAASFGMTGSNSALGKNGTISIGSSSTTAINILKYTGTGETSDKNINLSGGDTGGVRIDQSGASGQLVLTGNITNTGSGTKALTLQGSTAGTALLTGTIANSSGGNATNVTKSGTGTWTLSGNNTYTGTTTISGGTLVLNGTNSGSAITVNSGGTLAGSGTGGATTINNGGKIGPGNSPGILTVGNLTMNSGGIYTWEMADANGAAGTGWDQINATGLLTVGSNSSSTFSIAITSSGSPTNWIYTTSNQSWDIIDYGTIAGFNASNFTLNTAAFGGDLDAYSAWALTDTGSALRLTYTYTPLSPTYAGGTGNWSTGFTPAISTGGNATFAGLGGTATNDIASGTLSSIGSLKFDGVNSYTLEAASGSAGFNSASALAIGGAVTNNSSVVQTINIATSFAASQTLNANTGGIVIGGNMALASGATLTVVGSNSTTITGVVSGLGGLTKNSSSTLTLSGNNAYSGNTTIGQGKVLIGDNNAFGTGSVKLGISGVNATITIASTDGSARTISNTLDTFAGNSWVTTFGESSGGTGNLSFTSGTGVSLGSTSRTFNVLNTTSFANAFSTNSGAIIKTGTGTLILTGGSTYNGATTINAGTLQLGNGGTTGSLSTSSAITNNGTLVFNRSNAMTQGTAFAAVIAGTGNVVQAGSGTLVLSGVNTYTGTTTVSTGNITISNASALGSTGSGTTVANGAALQIQGDIAVGAEALNLTGSGFSNAGALRNLSGTNSLAGAITLSGATTIGADAGTLTLSGGISGTQNLTLVGAGNTTLSGAISTSTGTLTKNGSGTATLSAANTYSGSTTINSGTLVAAAANALGGTSQIVVNTGGSFLVTTDDSVNNSAGVTLAGGSLAFSGNRNETFGALTLSANSTLDFGTESVVAIFSSLAMNGYSLSVYNWTGTTLWNGGTGNNTDQFYVNSTMGDSDLARISFYSTSFQNSFLGDGYQIMSGGFANQIIPVPEPENYATAALLLLSGVIWSWKQRQRALRKTG